MLSILNSRVPSKKIGSWNDSPWITRDLKKLLRKKKRLYNTSGDTYKKSGKAVDKLKYCKFQKALKTKFKSAQDEYIENTLDCALKEKPKKFWSYKQDQIGIPPLNVNSKLMSDSTSKAEVLSNNFQQIFTKEDLSFIPNKGCSDIPAMDSVLFNREGIINLLKDLDSKKANGPDKLPTTLLKITASEIAEFVTFLFTQ